jgi:hypothetical protein
MGRPSDLPDDDVAEANLEPLALLSPVEMSQPRRGSSDGYRALL